MKFGRKQYINTALIIGIVLFLFTPVGFYVRVYVARLLSSSASVLKTELQLSVENYDWEMMDVNGHTFNFERARDKVVLINFWATWCPPCVAEMPSLQGLYDDYGDKVVFLFIAEDSAEKVTSFMDKKGYDLPVYYSKTEAPDLLLAKLLPTTYVLDKNGKIIIAETGAADWNSEKVRKILDGLLTE
ncbi:MAG: TlpA disulfide reductase family protein [Maribacter sp.]|uniref:TlpA family protein disulfide reductase n=1 Tax=Maribacter sp. TaxID=1897614 RepID=UPI003C71C0C2